MNNDLSTTDGVLKKDTKSFWSDKPSILKAAIPRDLRGMEW